MHAFARLLPLLLATTGALAQSPVQDLPKDLHGRWTSKPAGSAAVTQPFDLENIQRKDDGSFSARLTWTAADAKCTIRYQPITGRITSSGLAFEAKTPCDQPLSAELARGAAGAWVGMASNKATPPVVVELTAK
ncbi:hypothetical protein JJ685_09560 [Ramlibacter monticola]|uniref:Alkaline proteinase inhibitor/ Outer membrane lipoprotein Omp19 domain-containing protein n=1 Tax=Ramlibacter monticola TaxID=1926872 RepID=A0A937CT88_9BURK|nr:hypothetical protein [Ramlibacter monticola]MBL0391384.1 hypothetical protein [Ramlibacter monticola]